ncbi:MAG: hypothetical protein ACLP3C_17230 [Mycobacterium sp.]|uniref:hypothetical protein n=1 Tax=Mycobacterium sp. TaxID=1785 RepID=UPI003F9DE91C
MTAMLQDYDVATDSVAVKPQQRSRVAWIAGVATVVMLVIGGILIAAVPSLHEDVVAGTPTTNHAAVVQAAADRKIQAEAAQKAAEAAYLRGIEGQVGRMLQDKINAADLGIPITVIDTALIKVEPNKYEGMVTLQAAGYSQHQVGVHVTADDQHIMYSLDHESLYALLS